ncbi:DUF1566 domain-containing protein, partial [bacterium]|nr:DUF1566 domain-containing protein [bacterium]
MKIVRRLLAVLAVQLLSGFPAAQALTCANPDNAYSVNVDGTVLDKRNGLIWKQCSEGQSGSTCNGSATTHTWSGALSLAASSAFAGYSDWRLPNVKELKSLAEKCRSDPAINNTIFPATPSSNFWSGSPLAYDSYYGGSRYVRSWYVSFDDGNVNNHP